MAWIIDRDYLPDLTAPAGTLANAKGLAGPRSYQGDGSELCEPFRLLDDDGEVYYRGRSSDSSSFGPLDDFGAPNAGCTEIQYWHKERRRWETL